MPQSARRLQPEQCAPEERQIPSLHRNSGKGNILSQPPQNNQYISQRHGQIYDLHTKDTEDTMNNIKLRIISKIGLLFVVIGFFLPMSCNRENKTVPMTENKTDAITWTLNDGILTISGKGPIAYGSWPWRNLDDGSPDITAIIINDGVTNIGSYAFAYNDKVMYVSIPNSVTAIGEDAFKGCKGITSIIIPDGVINIGDAAFENCINLVSVNIPNSVLNIGNFAFRGCTKLITIDIPDSVLNIGYNAFTDCKNLLHVTLGKNVAYIGFDAFDGCKKIKTVTSNNPIPPHLETEEEFFDSLPLPYDNKALNNRVLESRKNTKYQNISAFDDLSEKCRLVIPDEYITAYKKDAQWNKFYIGRPVRVRTTKITREEFSQQFQEMRERAGW
jgi:hypothetical protein